MECTQYLVGLYQEREGTDESKGNSGDGSLSSEPPGPLALEGSRRVSFMPLDAKQRTPLDVANEFKKERICMYFELLGAK